MKKGSINPRGLAKSRGPQGRSPAPGPPTVLSDEEIPAAAGDQALRTPGPPLGPRSCHAGWLPVSGQLRAALSLNRFGREIRTGKQCLLQLELGGVSVQEEVGQGPPSLPGGRDGPHGPQNNTQASGHPAKIYKRPDPHAALSQVWAQG